MINLHKLNCIDENILKHTDRITFKNEIYTKINSTLAKNFNVMTQPTLYVKHTNWKILK